MHIGGLTLCLLVGALIPLHLIGDARLIGGVVLGYLVSLVNILLAFFSIKWAFRRSTRTFFSVVVGGMVVRFVILVLALFLVHAFTDIPLTAFAVSLIGFYLTLQVFEIRYIQNELNSGKAA